MDHFNPGASKESLTVEFCRQALRVIFNDEGLQNLRIELFSLLKEFNVENWKSLLMTIFSVNKHSYSLTFMFSKLRKSTRGVFLPEEVNFVVDAYENLDSAKYCSVLSLMLDIIKVILNTSDKNELSLKISGIISKFQKVVSHDYNQCLRVYRFLCVGLSYEHKVREFSSSPPALRIPESYRASVLGNAGQKTRDLHPFSADRGIPPIAERNRRPLLGNYWPKSLVNEENYGTHLERFLDKFYPCEKTFSKAISKYSSEFKCSVASVAEAKIQGNPGEKHLTEKEEMGQSKGSLEKDNAKKSSAGWFRVETGSETNTRGGAEIRGESKLAYVDAVQRKSPYQDKNRRERFILEKDGKDKVNAAENVNAGEKTGLFCVTRGLKAENELKSIEVDESNREGGTDIAHPIDQEENFIDSGYCDSKILDEAEESPAKGSLTVGYCFGKEEVEKEENTIDSRKRTENVKENKFVILSSNTEETKVKTAFETEKNNAEDNMNACIDSKGPNPFRFVNTNKIDRYGGKSDEGEEIKGSACSVEKLEEEKNSRQSSYEGANKVKMTKETNLTAILETTCRDAVLEGHNNAETFKEESTRQSSKTRGSKSGNETGTDSSIGSKGRTCVDSNIKSHFDAEELNDEEKLEDPSDKGWSKVKKKAKRTKKFSASDFGKTYTPDVLEQSDIVPSKYEAQSGVETNIALNENICRELITDPCKAQKAKEDATKQSHGKEGGEKESRADTGGHDSKSKRPKFNKFRYRLFKGKKNKGRTSLTDEIEEGLENDEITEAGDKGKISVDLTAAGADSNNVQEEEEKPRFVEIDGLLDNPHCSSLVRIYRVLYSIMVWYWCISYVETYLTENYDFPNILTKQAVKIFKAVVG